MMIQKFDLKPSLESALAQEIGSKLKDALTKFGNARILLSGGSTPFGLYRLLASEALDWSKISVGLVDERFVGLESPYSNEASIRSSLCVQDAANCHFLGMVAKVDDYEANVKLVDENYQLFAERTDVVVLGMGEDGHTASLFPNDVASEKLLKSTDVGVFNTTAPTNPTQRITCSAQLIKNAHYTYLMIVGEKKLGVLESAEEHHFPIAHFQSNMNVFFALN